jgi:hypothetical protein
MGKAKKPSSRFFGLWACSALTIMGLATGWAVPLLGQAPPADETLQPQLVTAQTKADPKKLAILQKPVKVFFEDGFESPDSLKKYFEIRGLKEGRARLVSDPKLAHSGKGTIQFAAPANDGRESGAGASGWLGPEGYDHVYFRRYIKFSADYDQGNLNHTGGGLAAVAGTDRWRAMGLAGIRPKGDDHFTSAFEPWRDWGRYPAPGYMFVYTYWVDMQRDPDGHFWGNMLGPQDSERMVLQRDRWYCLEHMIQVNDVGKANGELAAWIDGKLYIHYAGIRWRTSDAVKLKRFDIGVYVHQARKDNTVWYDDVALSTGYIGPTEGPEIKPATPASKQAEGAQ